MWRKTWGVFKRLVLAYSGGPPSDEKAEVDTLIGSLDSVDGGSLSLSVAKASKLKVAAVFVHPPRGQSEDDQPNVVYFHDDDGWTKFAVACVKAANKKSDGEAGDWIECGNHLDSTNEAMVAVAVGPGSQVDISVIDKRRLPLRCELSPVRMLELMDMVHQISSYFSGR